MRIDPKTRRIIISDLTPSHKNKVTNVHGVGDSTVLSKKELDDYKRQQEEKDTLNNLTAEYNAIIAGEMYASDRRGFEIR